MRFHRQGEHVAAVGPNGSGKTVLLRELVVELGRRPASDGRPSRVTVCGTKPRDKSLSAFEKRGYKRLSALELADWPPGYGEEHVIAWPKYKDPETMIRLQASVFRKLLRKIYMEGGQTVMIDEAAYFSEPMPEGLGLSALLGQFWYSARALDLSLIAGTQRPRRVSRSMWSEPAFVFIFQPDDEDDLKRVAEVSGYKREVLELVPRLGEHEFLLVWRQKMKPARRLLIVSRVDL